MYHDFISNLIDVLFFCGVAILIDLFLNKKYSQYIMGIIFGFSTIFVMQNHIMVVQGRFFDFRHITMTMAGFIGGPITAVIATLISSIYRHNTVGTGMMGGITNIIIFACFGSILGKLFRNKQNIKKPLFWFIIGIVMSCIRLLIIGFITPGLSGATPVIGTVSVLFLITTPLAMSIILTFYYWASDFFHKALILDTIINKSPINLMIFNAHKPVLFSNTLKTQHQSYPYIENPNLLLDNDKTLLNTAKQQHSEITTENERHFATDFTSFQMPSGEYACVAIVTDVTDRKREQETLRRANDRFSKAFQLGPHMMAILRKSDYRYIDVNSRYLEARGFAHKDVIGKTPIETGLPEREFIEIIEALEEKGSVQNIERTLVTNYGLIGTVLLSAEKIEIDDQECYLLAYNDITEMKRLQSERVEQLTKQLKLEAELSRSNQLIADIMNYMQDPFYVLDNQWRFTFVNKEAEVLLLKTREELLGNVLWETNPQNLGTLLELNYHKARNDCEPITFEFFSFLQKDICYQVTAYPSQLGLSVYYRDITEQKLSHGKLIKSQEEMASILESMTDCFVSINSDWQFTYINRAGETLFRKYRDEVLGKKMTELFKFHDTTLLQFNEVLNKKKPVSFEIISELFGNKYLELNAFPRENGLTCYFRDITSRKIAEETLRQSEEKFSKVFHGGPIMMILIDEREEAIDVNEAFCAGSGYTREEIIGRTSYDLNFYVDLNKRQERGKMIKEQGRIENAEIDYRTKSGEIRHGLSWSQTIYLDGRNCHIAGLIDVTEQKRMQQEMARLDRLNLVGQLAAGIAHEVRNPMTTVRGYLQLLGTKPDYVAQKSTFELMISEVDRANSIISEFLSLAQTKPTVLKSINLNDILNNLYPLIEAHTFTQNKQIIFMPREIPDLELNAKEISQMILNFTRNALEAMGERGTLTVKTYVEDSKVVLAIEDEGCGIPSEFISKIGTPFFTTKETGTGLGLASCYKIAESHSAKIRIDSSSRGTTFFILFPILYQEQEQIEMIV